MTIDAFVYTEKVRMIALALPETSEKRCYGTPGFYADKKLFARMKEDGGMLAVYTHERELWMRKQPAVYYITDHYLTSPMMLVNLIKVADAELKQLILSSWQLRAPKRLLKHLSKL